MSGRVVLHIGAMKTGTSYVQSVLQSNSQQCTDAGIRFVDTFGHQMNAVQNGLKGDFRGWNDLVAGVRAGATNVISMEFLSFARPHQIPLFLEPLSGHDVHVVLTVRDQLRALPAQWQSHTRNFGTTAWAEYLQEVCAGRPQRKASQAYRTFHRAQDLVTIVNKWRGGPGVGRFSVVTVPPPGSPRDELWLRFARAAGIDVPGVSFEDVKDNPSIGYASCDVLRRLNGQLFGSRPGDSPNRIKHPPPSGHKSGKRMPGYRKLVRALVRDALAPLRSEETKPEVHRAGAKYALRRNRALCELLADHGVDLVGSPEDLPVHGVLASFPAEVVPPPTDHVLRAARAMWNHLAHQTAAMQAPPEQLDDMMSDSARMLRGSSP
jgi:hypothetical protein